MNLFLYLEGRTWLHRLDPRTKLMGTLILFVLCLCFNHPLYLLLIALAIGALALSAKAFLNFWRLRWLLLLLMAFSTLLWPFFVRGSTAILAWGPLHLSQESIAYGVAMGLRLASFVSIGLVLLSTTRNEELTHGLIRMGLPHPVAFAFATALRLIPTFAGAGATIVQAQIARGLDLEEGNLLRRIGKFIPQAVPLFLYAIRHTNFLAMALESRGFSPGAARTFYHELRMRWIDYGAIVFLLVLLGGALYLRLGQGWGVILPGRL